MQDMLGFPKRQTTRVPLYRYSGVMHLNVLAIPIVQILLPGLRTGSRVLWKVYGNAAGFSDVVNVKIYNGGPGTGTTIGTITPVINQAWFMEGEVYIASGNLAAGATGVLHSEYTTSGTTIIFVEAENLVFPMELGTPRFSLEVPTGAAGMTMALMAVDLITDATFF